MSQPIGSNFLLTCNTHGSECPDLLNLVEQTKTKGERFTVHSLNDCHSKCFTIQAFLLCQSREKEGFHIHYEKRCVSEKYVRRTLPQPEITIILAPRRYKSNNTRPAKDVATREELYMEGKEVSSKKPFELKKIKRIRGPSNSRSRSRSKSGPRETMRRMKEKQDAVKRNESHESERLSLVEKRLDQINTRLESQDTSIKDIQKTQVSFAVKQYVLEQNQKIYEDAVNILDKRTLQNTTNIEKLEKTCERITQVNNDMAKSNQEMIRSNQTISTQFQEIMTLHKATMVRLNRHYNQDTPRESVTSRENTGGLTAYAFSSGYMTMDNNGRANSLTTHQRKGFMNGVLPRK